jgi:3-oxocholest-4-en-26-oate---CoA ligase
MAMHFATAFEAVADAVPDATALVHGDARRTWAAYDERAARIASALVDAGLGPDAKVGLYLYNSSEYLEAHYGAFKMRGVPVNVNYRYLDEELWYLLDNADAEALVFHTSLGDRVSRVAGRLPKLRLLVQVDDGGEPVTGAIPLEELVEAHPPMPRIERPESDVYMLYTGGTTGMPKGVMYPQGGICSAFVQLSWPLPGEPVPSEVSALGAAVRHIAEEGKTPVSVPACPLMHGTGMWLGALMPHLQGGSVITLASRTLDAHELLATVQRERATSITIVGDAFAKPIVRAIDEAAQRDEPYDLSSLAMVVSSGVMWTAEVKEAVLDRVPQVVLVDAIGSTEGSMGMSISMRGMPAQTAKFSRSPATKVFKEDLSGEVVPGSGEAGLVAAGGLVPLGYFKDEAKSASTFKVVGGARYSFPGDLALVEADGSITLLGRGSQCINTGGEKVYPEEVEEAVKRVDGVDDCLVVGVPDEKFGEVVTAVVSGRPDLEAADVIASVKEQLSHYKAPKHVVLVASVPRAPNGKADYKSAKQLALAAVGTS